MNIAEVLAAGPVVPVIVIDSVENAVPLARALLAGGIRVLEVTLRTRVAFAAVERIAGEVEGAIVGVGTVTDAAEIARAVAAGARFAVSPGFTPSLAGAARASGLPLLPGVMTPSDIIAAGAAGLTALKFFPAREAGGIAMLKALAGPFPHVRFCPTGGITRETAADYLALANVACVGGSWMTPKDALARGDFAAITRLADEARALRPQPVAS